RVRERTLPGLRRFRLDPFTNDLFVSLLSLDQLPESYERARPVDHQGWRVNERIGTAEAISGGGVVLVLQGLIAFPRERACRGPIRGTRFGPTRPHPKQTNAETRPKREFSCHRPRPQMP